MNFQSQLTWADLGDTYDGPHATPQRVSSGPYFLNISSLSNGRLDLRQSDHVSEEEFTKWTRRVTPQADDLLFSYETRLGEAALMPDAIQACLGRRMALLRPNRDVVHPQFMLYYYLSPAFQRKIEQNTIYGATVNRISLSSIGKWPVTIPPLKYQQAIAEVLGAFDDKITLNSKLADNADSFIKLQFEAAMQRSAPVLKPFFEAFDVEFGEAFKGDKFVEPGMGRPLIRIRDLKTFTSQIWTTESRPKEVIVNAGDVVVGMDAEFRPTSWLGEPGLLNQRVCRVTSKLGNSALVREALRKPLATIENYKTATTVIHLNKKDLEENSVLLPDGEAIASFESITENLYQFRIALASENRTLAAARDALLPELMSGALGVKDAEALVETVV